MNDAEKRLLRSVQRVGQALARLERGAAAAHDVSVSQLRTLSYLSERDGASVGELALEQALAISTMTRNLLVLERCGLISRAPSVRDRRAVQVQLTEAGRMRAQALLRTTLARLARAFDGFHPTDRVERAAALDRVAGALERSEP